MAGNGGGQADKYVRVSLEAERETGRPAVARSDQPFRILVLANLSGSRERKPLAQRTPVLLDRDNIDEVIARIAPSIQVGGDVVSFQELEDFHADRLWARLPLFQALRDLRDRLDNPRTFDAAARELLGGAPPPLPAAHAESSGSLLDQIVTEVAGAPPPPAAPARQRSGDELQEEIRRIVQPHIIPGEDPRKAALTERVEAASAELLRTVLHDPAFQRLESAWRALDLLARRMETGEQLGLYAIDVTREELMADFDSQQDATRSALHRWLIDGAETNPWSVVVGDFRFGPAEDDLRLLSRIADIARFAGVSFLAGANPALAGAPGFDRPIELAEWADAPAQWSAFRRSSDASVVGLALPRFLVRLPYGRDGEECEEIAFEEMSSPPRHEEYLWANAAYAAALLLADSFTERGWQMRPGTHQDVAGLPLHIYRIDGVAQAQPCAESVMTERAAARLIESGLMPLASLKDNDTVRMVRFQSAAQPQASLVGPWLNQPG